MGEHGRSMFFWPLRLRKPRSGRGAQMRPTGSQYGCRFFVDRGIPGSKIPAHLLII